MRSGFPPSWSQKKTRATKNKPTRGLLARYTMRAYKRRCRGGSPPTSRGGPWKERDLQYTLTQQPNRLFLFTPFMVNSGAKRSTSSYGGRGGGSTLLRVATQSRFAQYCARIEATRAQQEVQFDMHAAGSKKGEEGQRVCVRHWRRLIGGRGGEIAPKVRPVKRRNWDKVRAEGVYSKIVQIPEHICQKRGVVTSLIKSIRVTTSSWLSFSFLD